MDKNVVTLENITYLVKPLVEKCKVKEIYLVRMRGEKPTRAAIWTALLDSMPHCQPLMLASKFDLIKQWD